MDRYSNKIKLFLSSSINQQRERKGRNEEKEKRKGGIICGVFYFFFLLIIINKVFACSISETLLEKTYYKRTIHSFIHIDTSL